MTFAAQKSRLCVVLVETFSKLIQSIVSFQLPIHKTLLFWQFGVETIGTPNGSTGESGSGVSNHVDEKPALPTSSGNGATVTPPRSPPEASVEIKREVGSAVHFRYIVGRSLSCVPQTVGIFQRATTTSISPQR